MPRKGNLFLVAVSLALHAVIVTTSASAAQTADAGCAEMKAFDPDNDGTMDMDEARKAALALFDKLDHDKDGTLDARELSGRLTSAQLRAADPDHDGTLDKSEFLKVVEKRFEAANPDQDVTIECKEFRTPAGKSLLRVLEK